MKERVLGMMLTLLLLLLIGVLTLALNIQPVKTDLYSIGFGDTVFASIDPAGDDDTYTFSANANDVVFVRMTATSGGLDPEIKLNAPNGTGLARDWGETVAEISYTLPDYGEYTILAFDNVLYTVDTGNYSIFTSG